MRLLFILGLSLTVLYQAAHAQPANISDAKIQILQNGRWIMTQGFGCRIWFVDDPKDKKPGFLFEDGAQFDCPRPYSWVFYQVITYVVYFNVFDNKPEELAAFMKRQMKHGRFPDADTKKNFIEGFKNAGLDNNFIAEVQKIPFGDPYQP